MRKLFLIVVIALALASVCTVLSLRSKADRPVLVWATGICPERYEQAELFRKWLVRNGHTAPDGGPVCDIELQASDQQSSLIQAVSGMGSDLIDRIAVERFAPMGVLEDITEFARENGLNPERNYGPAAELLTCEGRQYVYPCNLACYGLLVNVDTFEKVGMAAPPEEWTPEEFERIGLEFTRRANAGKPRQEVFFCAWTPMMLQLARSRGADVFNETLTAAKLNRTEFIDAVKLQHKWTEIDHLMPTAAERAGDHSRQSVNNDASLLFASGRYAMFLTGRYANMDLRRMKQPVRQSFSQLPQFGFKNMRLLARSTGIYRGTKYPEYAKLFLLFLADREYNNQIITGADGLPPNPAFAENNPEYLNPPEYPNEGNLHANELKWAKTIGFNDPVSPYYPLGDNKLNYAYEKFTNGLATPGQALTDAERFINHSIAEHAASSGAIRKRYEADCALQRKIDEYKAEGKKLPTEWIRNSFLRAWYAQQGMLE